MLDVALDKQAEVWRLHAEGLCNREIGERLGVPKGTVSNWRNGRRTPLWSLEPFRARFEQMEAAPHTSDAAPLIALRLGWFDRGRPDGHRVRRVLGLRPASASRGYPPSHRQHIQRRTALQLCEAMGMDPAECGL